MFRIILCDDQKEILRSAAAFTAEVLKDTPHDIRTFDGAEQLLAADIADTDLFILDIGMPVTDGFELSEKIRAVCPDAKVVFLTSEAGRVFDGYKYRAFRFVLKGDGEAFREALLAARPTAANVRIALNIKGRGTVGTAVGDIFYFEYNIRRLSVCLKDGIHEIAGGRLSDFTERLTPLGFVCVHRSFLVNMAHIAKFEKNDILLTNNTKINMGTKSSAIKQIKQSYFRYLEEMP